MTAPYQTHSETSRAAAEAIAPSLNELQAVVYEAIKAAGLEGRTDDEMQVQLGMNPSTQRPRRIELRDDFGLIVASGTKRPTRSGQLSNVWVVAQAKKARQRVLEGCDVHGQDRETVRARWDAASTAKVPDGKVILACRCCDAPALGALRTAYDEAGNELPGGVADAVNCSKCVEVVA